MAGEKKDKLFLDIHAPEWLYDELIDRRNTNRLGLVIFSCI
jgi:hypothetical protein